MNRLVDAPKNISLAENPKWKWKELNEVSFNVVVSYIVKTDDIGGAEEQKGEYRVSLQRSVDGVVFNPDAKLLNNGKWLPLLEGSKNKVETVREF